MILMREGMGPEIETFFGPEMVSSDASALWGPKKSGDVE